MNTFHWLAYSALITGVFWMVYVGARVQVLGLFGALDNISIEGENKLPPWAQRAKRAHANAVENLVVFASLVLCAQGLGVADKPLAVLAAQIYFFARAAHFVAYTLGIPGVRTLLFATGFAAQVMMFVAVGGT